MQPLPTIAITMGDPAGVGPEIILKALARPEPWEVCRPVVVGDPLTLERARRVLGKAPGIREVSSVAEEVGRGEIPVLRASGEDLGDIAWGKVDPRCGRAQVDFVRRAVDLVLDGEAQAVVTAPIHKMGLRLAGVDFPGHTEMLAHWTGTSRFAMMLAGERLRVVPVTLHCSLRHALERLSAKAIEDVAHLTHEALRHWFNIPTPRLAIAGLNPHAGDGGLFGDEENRIIAPAVRALQGEGIQAQGPMVPDAVFRMAADGLFDAVVAMYHDQGLIPIKLLERDQTVNVTLGLPILRTSVDHGTAYDIAGTGKASQGSLLAAIGLAARLARNFPGLRPGLRF